MLTTIAVIKPKKKREKVLILIILSMHCSTLYNRAPVFVREGLCKIITVATRWWYK